MRRRPATPDVAAVHAVHVAAVREGAGVGVGTALETELVERAREDGRDAVALTASVNAVPFYDGRGYRAVAAVVHEFGGREPAPAVEMRRAL